MIQHQRRPKFVALFLAMAFSFATWAEEAKDYQLLFQAGSYSFTANRPNRAAEEVQGFGSYSLSFAIPFWQRFSVSAGMTLVSSQGFGGDTATGFDLSSRYFPLSSSGYQKINDGTLELSYSSVWRPYVGIAFRQRQFLTTLTTTYVGPGVVAGLDWLFSDKAFANFEIRYDLLTGQSEATATQYNILFGVGLHL